MPKLERVREILTGRPGPEYWQDQEAAGWRLSAVEWTREVPGEGEELPRVEDVPYGTQVAGDCQHLEANRTENQALILMLDLIGRDEPLSRVAEELNRQGFRTRQGARWNIETVFHMLPRLIDAAPRIFSSPEWDTRRALLAR